MPDVVTYIKDALHTLNIWKHEIITILKQPTPHKFMHVVQTLPDGCIGSGLDDLSYPETLWECPTSHEAWIHRLLITSPQYTPASPLGSGQILVFASTGEIVTWSPQPTLDQNTLPAELIHEGALSAPHLTPGTILYVTGDQLPPGITVRFDIQLNLVSGISSATPIPHVGSAITSPNGSE